MAHVEPGDAQEEMREQQQREDERGEEPCRPNDRNGLCWTHSTCEYVTKQVRDKDAELKARREILDALSDAAGNGDCWLNAATLDWRQRLRDFAEDTEQHTVKRLAWKADHRTFPGIVLYAAGGFYTAYFDDAAELWQQADDDKPMFHVMVESDPPHRTCIHPLHLHAWVLHLAEIKLPVSIIEPDDPE